MAKQTFTTGSVLTAAQMTSLQQTAMLGGAASAKTANYTLVAADAGTLITMSNAGATTITVNTGLFAAGDTVTILNIGAGTCTITAGTATVAKPTNATLALVTSAGGVLYFTATGAATFMPFDVGSSAGSANGCGLYLSAAQSISTGTNTNVLWDAEYYDTNNYHSTSSNTDRISVPAAGKYQVFASLTFGGNATAGRQMEIRRFNSSNVQQETRLFYYQWTTPNAVETVQGSATFDAAAGDYFVIVARQDSGSSLNIRAITNGDTTAYCVSLGS